MTTKIQKALYGAALVAFIAAPVMGTACAGEAASTADWSGFYLGLGGGATHGEALWTYTNNNAQVLDSTGGGIAGIDATILRQSGSWVAGLQGNADFTNLQGKKSCPNIKFDCSANIKGLESLRGLIGLSADRWLVYGTAGLGFEQVSEKAVEPVTALSYSTAQRTKVGWVLGGGIETMLNSRVAVGAEYLHYGFGTDNRSIFDAAGVSGGNADYRESADVVEAKISFKLNGTETHVPMK